MKKNIRKLYHINRLAQLQKDNDILDELLVDQPRVIKNKAEYEYLYSISQQPFNRKTVLKGMSLKGYVIGITPIISKEQFYVVTFALENGCFLSHPFALAKEMNDNFHKLVDTTNITNNKFLTDVFAKECSLYVSPYYEGSEIAYFLHDITHLLKKESEGATCQN